jgi:hypothetical protein
MSESIIRKALHIGGGWLAKREVNEEGPAFDAVWLYESPVTAIAAVIAIISQHKIAVRGHR